MNILIVDDEPIIRIGLKTLIDWDKHGLNLLNEASNGIEALEIIQSGQVDILITDIRMPLMDGLELIRRTNLFTKDIKILVLSCLDDFSYVKEAMKLGARDYILKPTMEPEELLTIIQHLAITLQEERTARQQLILWHNEMEQSRQFQLSARVSSFLRDNMADTKAIEELFIRENGLYSLMVYGPLSINMPMDSLEFQDCIAVTRLQSQAWFLLFSSGQRYSQAEQHKLAFSKAQEIAAMMRSHPASTPMNWLICIGPNISTPEELIQRISYHQSQVQQQYYAVPREHIVWHRSGETGRGIILPYEHRNDLLRAVSNNNPEAIFHCTDQITQAFAGFQPEVAKLQAFVFETLSLAVSYAGEQGYSDLEPFIRQYVSLEKIQEFLHIVDLNSWMVEAMQELWGYRFGGGASAVSDNHFIKKALKYMKLNFNKNIGTTDISDYVKLSRSYLSDLYSKEMNESLTETLAHIRIDEAKKKLRSGEKKIYEIAAEVGFTDSKTFAKTFKKIVGCSPKEYDLQNK
ncbi:MAG TPA: response regulator [Bacilli bacterium]